MAKKEKAKLITRHVNVLEDPGAAHIARVYAVSLLDAAGKDADSVLEEYGEFIDDVLPKVPDLAKLLLSQSMGTEDLVALFDKAIAPQVSPLFANFLRVLARHRRLDLFRLTFQVATLEAEKRAGKKRIQVRSATELSKEATKELTAKLKAAIAAEPILETTVDPSILGGLVVRIGDTVYDGSLRTRIQQLNGRLRERYLHEIQRGRDRFSNPEGN
jgi:F-type H+-transporting ATPase subunit delta